MADVHTVDPEGNVTLILNLANRPTGVSSCPILEFQNCRSTKPSHSPGESWSSTSQAGSNEDENDNDTQSNTTPADGSTEKPLIDLEEEGAMHIRVSSAHLSLASPVFYALLHGCPLRESDRLLTHGSLSLSLTGRLSGRHVDPHARRPRQVPVHPSAHEAGTADADGAAGG